MPMYTMHDICSRSRTCNTDGTADAAAHAQVAPTPSTSAAANAPSQASAAATERVDTRTNQHRFRVSHHVTDIGIGIEISPLGGSLNTPPHTGDLTRTSARLIPASLTARPRQRKMSDTNKRTCITFCITGRIRKGPWQHGRYCCREGCAPGRPRGQ